ncbi:MAG: hypothetical protein O3A53_02510 [Acidobacteria bacterium]|nr:hypothetical protein [Acidobacteriota bacterium]
MPNRWADALPNNLIHAGSCALAHPLLSTLTSALLYGWFND